MATDKRGKTSQSQPHYARSKDEDRRPYTIIQNIKHNQQSDLDEPIRKIDR